MVARDRNSNAFVLDDDTFTLIAELEVRKAVRLQYFVSLLAIHPDVDGGPVPEDVYQQVAEIVRTEVRGTDVIGLLRSTGLLHILLTNAPLADLAAIIERITRAVSRHVFRIDDQRMPVTLSTGGACFPTTARGRDDLFGQVHVLAAEAREQRTGRSRYRLASNGL
jgi:GGDEF domain-containing protein